MTRNARIYAPLMSMGLVWMMGCQGPDVVSRDGEEPARRPLAKAAAADQYFLVKDYTDPVSGTFSETVAVPPNGNLSVETRSQGSTNPALIAYYTSTGSDSAYEMKVVGVDRDGGPGVDALVQWKNSSGSYRLVRIVAFAEGGTPAGTADVSIRVNLDPVQTYPAVPVAGRVYADNNVAANPGASCPTHIESRVSGAITDFATVQKSIFVLGVNGIARTGMEVLFGVPKSGVTSPLQGGNQGFLLVFQPMVQAGTPLLQGTARVTQENGYDCF